MAMNLHQAQRRLLLQGLGLAALLPARLGLAAPGPDPESPRLVVVMLRGALDGLAAVPAIGDPDWGALRGSEPTPALPLDGWFGLHPALAELHRWWGEKQLLVLHAVASPYRERSHFDAQQVLESGGERAFALSTGWLGRALQASGRPAVALSSGMPLALRGADQASTWTPAGRGDADEDLLTRIGQLYQGDAALSTAWSQAMTRQGMAAAGVGSGGAQGFAALARQAGHFLSTEAGPKVAWLESGGWDTHAQQSGRLQRQLAGLDAGLAALRQALGPQWSRTSVLVMTEFGRSAVLNGSGGTDHGTGGVALLAGGAVAGGQVLCDWPGLARAQLLDARDLRPTLDLRRLLAAVSQHQFGLSQAQLTTTVLPGVASPNLALWRT